MPIDTIRTGAAIAAHRQRMNLSQQGLAGLMNVTHQAVSKWEKGLALPDTETLLALAKLFGTSMEALLTGVLPAEAAPCEMPDAEEAPSSEEPAESADEPAPASTTDDPDFSSIMNMLPFVSSAVADQLFFSFVSSGTPDAGKLLSIVPFVSSAALSDYISSHPLRDCSPEIIGSIAPFLSAGAVDEMILNLKEPLPPHVVKMLLPFASTGTVDRMVLGSLGLSAGSAAKTDQPPLRPVCSVSDRNAANTQPKFEKIEGYKAFQTSGNPRMLLLRKALESGHYSIIENSFGELDGAAYHMLIDHLKQTGDASLLDLLCTCAAEMDPIGQLELTRYLISSKLYSRLSEVIDELDDDIQQQLTGQALQSNDPELLLIISEHL